MLQGCTGHDLRRAGSRRRLRAVAPTYDTVIPFFTTLGARLVDIAQPNRAGSTSWSAACSLVPDPPLAAASIPAEGGPAWAFLGQVFNRYAAGRPVIVPFRPDFDLPGTSAGADLDVTTTVVEDLPFHFSDERTWWGWAWSHGMRGLLEVLPAEDLEGLQRDMFAELGARRTPDGIPMPQRATFVVTEKTAG